MPDFNIASKQSLGMSHSDEKQPMASMLLTLLTKKLRRWLN